MQNKRDVFAEKIELHPLADWFPEFAVVGSNTFEAAAGWIKEQVSARALSFFSLFFLSFCLPPLLSSVHDPFDELFFPEFGLHSRVNPED